MIERPLSGSHGDQQAFGVVDSVMQDPAAIPAPEPLGMPEPAPLAMPVQDFARRPTPGRTPPPVSDDMDARRTILILATLLIAVLAGTELRLALSRDGLQPADIALLLLFWPLFAWIAFGFVQATIGYVRLVSGAARVEPTLPRGVPQGRSAILIPVRNEDAVAVAGRVAAMAKGLAGLGVADRFAFFLLSDSTVDAGREEAAVFSRLARSSPVTVHYRRRPVNHARKPGNVADWVRKHGAAWDYMLVLDADSMMGARTIVGLANAMDREPGMGLIQTVPTVIGARTLFARWQQFASRLYGPVASAGLMWWSGSEATFWGHNAIVRTVAFAESCGLPALSGPAPFGGSIMSHDMVEAALLRRNGWAVHMIMAADSAEEYPPTLVDHAIRDRRWCQGNVQHLRLLGTAGLHWVSRLQFLIGASAYLTSPLWLLLLLAASAGRLGPETPQGVAALAPSPWILLLTLLLLFGPKLMGVAWALSDDERRRGFGGARRLLAGVAIDIPLAVLTAPATMLTQTIALAEIMIGRASGWAPQSRAAHGIPFPAALRHYRLHLVSGAVLAIFSIAMGGGWGWMAPVFAGLMTAPSLAALTSRRDLGDRAAMLGIFQVPGGQAAGMPAARADPVTAT